MVVRMSVLVLACALAAGAASRAEASERGRALENVRQLHRACREAEQPGRRTLYSVVIPPRSYRLGPLDDEGFLPIDTRRNLRAFDGAAQLFPSSMESIGFIAGRARARELIDAVRQGAPLRIGFFLGFDNPDRSPCLLRPAAVTTVRMDVAYVELLRRDGRVLAREDTERLRAWIDDRAIDAVPGRGPRGVLGAASRVGAGIAPEPWQRALAAANQGAVHDAIGACHAAGVTRGASAEGQVVVRLAVDGRSGAVRESEVELSSIGDDEEASCIAQAIGRHLRLPPSTEGGTIALSVPVRLAAGGGPPPARGRGQSDAERRRSSGP